MKFKNWLERKEMDLYHGTTTGDDEKNLKSFNQGIKPKSSSGHGQGAGYYAYSDKEYAKNTPNLYWEEARLKLFNNTPEILWW